MTGISGQNYGVPSPLPLLGLSPAELMRALSTSDHPQILDPGTTLEMFVSDANGKRVNTARVVKSTAAIALDDAGSNSRRIISADLSTVAKMNYSDGKIAAYVAGTAEPAGVMLGGYTEQGAASTTTKAGDNLFVLARGIVRLRAAGAFGTGVTFKSDANGKAVATVAGDRITGISLTGPTGANALFWAFIDCVGLAVAKA